MDFVCRDGLLLVVLKNVGSASAHRVSTRFDRPFRGLGGTKRLSDLRLFRRLDFMPPGKEFTQLVDLLARYLERREPTRLRATVSYRDRQGRRFEDVMTHDPLVYRDLGEARPSA